MNQKIISGPDPGQSFIHFILFEKKNRSYLLVAGAATVVQFIVFKLLYPYPDFFSDSWSYISAASANLDINIWPIGYSKFLMAFHSLTHSDIAVVAFQYFFLEFSTLYLFFTLLYFYTPSRTTKNILFIFLFFNPLFLYLSNYINSDPLFAGLSLCWIGELLWIVNRPRPYHILSQAILLFLAFTVRHNALYYPFVAAIAFAISRERLWVKLAGAASGFVLAGLFVIHEQDAAYQMYGLKQFSPMSGWLLANNALYIRGQIHVDSSQLPSAETKELDRLSRKFYSDQPSDFHEYLAAYVANFFIREPSAPLKQYFSQHYRPKDNHENVKAWGQASVVFSEYGKYLIKNYPIAFTRYFILLNTKNYFFPPLEKLEVYNLGEDDVPANVQDWFDFKTPNVSAISKDMQASILSPFPYLFFFANVLFIGSLIWLFAKGQYHLMARELRTGLFLVSGFLIANFCFCVFTTIIVLRYQFFPLIITLAFPLLLIEYLDKKETENKKVVSPGTDSVNLELSQA
ncbi:MAG: hypothetical protein P4L51_10925 [Puia sp.]|nr:hypothetical protein [Puia sp.]